MVSLEEKILYFRSVSTTGMTIFIIIILSIIIIFCSCSSSNSNNNNSKFRQLLYSPYIFKTVYGYLYLYAIILPSARKHKYGTLQAALCLLLTIYNEMHQVLINWIWGKILRKLWNFIPSSMYIFPLLGKASTAVVWAQALRRYQYQCWLIQYKRYR